MRDTPTVGFALGAGCTPDDAARFAIYCQNHCPGLRLSDCFEDWHNLVYVARIERVLSGRVAA
jgi:hypothetical protein